MTLKQDHLNMRTPQSVEALEDLGRVRLSSSFFMREFLYSEIANHHGIRNVPTDPGLAVEAGSKLCEHLLEPLQATWGRVAIRSAYRSPEVNELGNQKGYNCGSNKRNAARHIWDMRDDDGCFGAMACVVIPRFTDLFAQGADWRAMAYWIHNHLPYSELQFFPKLCAFNIGWHERPRRAIHSYIEPAGNLLEPGQPPSTAFAAHYAGLVP